MDMLMDTPIETGSVIFLVSHSAPGGAQELWSDLAEGFAAAGYRVRLMALYPSLEHGEALSRLRWEAVRPAKPANIAAAVGLVVALARILRRERPRMVFTAMPAANIVAPVAAVLARAGTRVCISHHSPAFTHRRLLNLVDNVTGTLACIRSVVTVSETVARSLENKPPSYRRKRTTIPNALPPRIEASLQALGAARPAGTGGRRRVAAIGRLSEEKNHAVLLRAAVHMPDVEIAIAGSGPLEGPLRRLAALLGVAGRVHFLGQKTRAQALEILAGADVFAQPSVFEGHSLALLEAARLGLPIVVSDAPGQIEAITRTDGTRCGIAVGLHDDVALAHALQRLLDDSAHYRHWAGAAAQLADEATYVRMVSAYRELLAP